MSYQLSHTCLGSIHTWQHFPCATTVHTSGVMQTVYRKQWRNIYVLFGTAKPQSKAFFNLYLTFFSSLLASMVFLIPRLSVFTCICVEADTVTEIFTYSLQLQFSTMCYLHSSQDILKVQAKRMLEMSSRTEPSSHTNYRYLSYSELIHRLLLGCHQRQPTCTLQWCQRLTMQLMKYAGLL